MKKIVLGSLLPLMLAPTALSSSKLTVTPKATSGDCLDVDFSTELNNGQENLIFYLQGTDLEPTAEGSTSSDTRRCTIDYDVQLAPGYRLVGYKMAVNGFYDLSDTGAARVTISHRVVGGKNIRYTKSFSARRGDSPVGDFNSDEDQAVTGAIYDFQLDPQYRECGATIPFVSSIYAQVYQSRDEAGFSMLRVDEGQTRARLAQMDIQKCH